MDDGPDMGGCPVAVGVLEQIRNRVGSNNDEFFDLIQGLDRSINILEDTLSGPSKAAAEVSQDKLGPVPEDILARLDRTAKLRCMLNNSINRLSKLVAK